ncbi:multidrug effflux MFS transporter [Facilibium subflavum]|uniref:multidrug effflux MFS transporter n=1 Tax=Facilibium subflavum TaxID=2219058 RepID=UPI0013C375B4|nr:multidrug effflux MFS transporter [Facilibium subflavum]
MIKTTTNSSKSLWLICTFSILLGFSYFLAADMYVPSLPMITKDFVTNSSVTRLSISFFLISLAVSQLVYGPASDKYGRKPILMTGGIVYLIASILCVLSFNIETLLIGRFLQGVGAGALMGLSRTIIQDWVSKEKLMQIVGWLSMFFLLAPAVAPTIGGFVEAYAGWRVSFVIMAVFIAIVLPGIRYVLPETHPKAKRDTQALNASHMAKNYLEMLLHARFMIYIFCMIAGFAGVIAFYTIGPFIFIEKLGFSAQGFGLLSLLILSCAFISRFYVALYALKRFGVTGTIFQGLVLLVGASFVLLLLSKLQAINGVAIMICLCVYVMGSSLIGPTVVGSALSFFKHKAGAAGAMYGFLQMFGMFLVSTIASFVTPNAIDLALILLVLSVTALILFVCVHVNVRQLLGKHRSLIL